jgi:sugar lactone lactonase YvrE
MSPAIRKTIAIFLCFILISCSGGGDSSAPTSPPATTPPTGNSNGTGTGPTIPQPVSSNTISADSTQTTVGGASISLTAPGGNTAQWALAPNSPGSLDSTNGRTVHYIPPPSGSTTSSSVVTIVAVVNNVASSITILVSGSANASSGTVGAGTITPTASNVGGATGNSSTQPAPGLYLIAGNDFGPGVADGTGTAARFNSPYAIARDANGNLYIADTFNFVVRRIAPNGEVTTLAGTPGMSGFADGPAASARFSDMLTGVAVDNAGNVYVADSGNSRIRKIAPNGVVSTLAGGPDLWQLNGIAVDSAGNVYVAGQFMVRKVTPDGTVTTIAGQDGSPGFQDGPAAAARFIYPKGIAFDASGNIFVVDGDFEPGPIVLHVAFLSAAIRKITPDGQVVTIAGAAWDGLAQTGINQPTGYVDGPGLQARFNYPDGLTIDRSGNLFVADRGNQVIRRITPDGIVSTVAGAAGQQGSADGPDADARFSLPRGIVIAPDGALYVTEAGNHTVRKVVPGGSVSTLAGAALHSGSTDGTGANALFNSPTGLALDGAGNLYLADSGNSTIRKINQNGVVTTVAGVPGQQGSVDGPAASARFKWPTDVAVDSLGNLFVADFQNQTIRRISVSGTVTTYAGITGMDSEADGPTSSAQFSEPDGIVVDANGNVFVSDRGGDSIRKITPQGLVSTFASNNASSTIPVGDPTNSQIFFPQDLTFDAAGNLYFIDINGTIIRKATPTGALSILAGTPYAFDSQDGTGASAHFAHAQGIAVDSEGNLYVGDTNSVRKISPLGVVTTVAGIGASGSGAVRSLQQPTSIVVTGPKTLAITAGNGVFELVLP